MSLLDRAEDHLDASAGLAGTVGGTAEISEVQVALRAVRVALRAVINYLRALDSASSSLPSSGAAPSRVSELVDLLKWAERAFAEGDDLAGASALVRAIRIAEELSARAKEAKT
jgi:hypothetical protein